MLAHVLNMENTAIKHRRKVLLRLPIVYETSRKRDSSIIWHFCQGWPEQPQWPDRAFTMW